MAIEQWLRRQEARGGELIPASTVVVVRDGEGGLEVLLMRRSAQVSFAEGAWVFPGGRIDPEDLDDADDERRSAITAAVREAKEEADLDLDHETLVQYSHWVPPLEAPKRFSTWFFLAPAPDGIVTVDRGEITEHSWWRPDDALERAAQRRISVLPPTWVTLLDLLQFPTVDAALESVRGRGPRGYASRIARLGDDMVSMWEGDAGYESGDAGATGTRHRLVMSKNRWEFQLG
jgi:8-oxo-dGTP pyrophosphatase MutT (NUDIX family)